MSQRKILTLPQHSGNATKWMHVVEEQTGKSFNIGGSVDCLVEEVTELHLAMKHENMAEARDAVGDIYVAANTTIETVRRKYPGAVASAQKLREANIAGNITDESMAIIHAAINGRRKDKPHLMLAAAFVAQDFAKRVSAYLGEDFSDCVNDVFDTLETRITEGYTMSNDGSAIKTADVAA